jgi:hypothetical protein
MLFGGSAKIRRAEPGSIRPMTSIQSPVMIRQSDVAAPRKRKWPGVDDTRAGGKRKMSSMGNDPRPASWPGNAALQPGDGPRRRVRRGPIACDYPAVMTKRSRHAGGIMAYYTRFGPISGPLRSASGYHAVGVLPARESRTAIGLAVASGQDQHGRALWRLSIDTLDLPGLYVVTDRQFRPAHRSGRGPCEGGRGRGRVAGMRRPQVAEGDAGCRR